MLRRASLHPLSIGALVALLLLQLAAPGLAAAAARARGAALVELCTAYGVRTVAVDALGTPLDAKQPPAPGDETAAAGAADGCALASLPAFDLPPAAARHPAPAPAVTLLLAGALSESILPDRNRAWWSGLKQGPPRS